MNTQVLLPHRQVEAERLAHRLALELGGVGADHHRDRIADQVDADEDERRHHHHDQRRLHQAADDVDDHLVLAGPRRVPRRIMIDERATGVARSRRKT